MSKVKKNLKTAHWAHEALPHFLLAGGCFGIHFQSDHKLVYFTLRECGLIDRSHILTVHMWESGLYCD